MGLFDKLVKEGKKVVDSMIPEDNKETGGGAGTSFADDCPEPSVESAKSASNKDSSAGERKQ